MSIHHWQLLQEVQDSLRQTSDLPTGFVTAIAERLDETLNAAQREPLETLQEQLHGLFLRLMALAPETASAAVRLTANSGKAEQAAYMLGQISFAQLIAAQAVERRVSDEFAQFLQDGRYQPYVAALSKKACTGKELADLCNEAVETVSRKLKILRELGIAEHRREGTSFNNYLTPAARALVENSIQQDDIHEAIKNKGGAVRLLNAQIPEHMREAKSLSTVSRKAA